jgi:hypothetical protein
MDTDARGRADATFEKKEKRAVEANAAWADYKAEQAATDEKTARLRALRLAREAQAQPATPSKPKHETSKVRRVRAR